MQLDSSSAILGERLFFVFPVFFFLGVESLVSWPRHFNHDLASLLSHRGSTICIAITRGTSCETRRIVSSFHYQRKQQYSGGDGRFLISLIMKRVESPGGDLPYPLSPSLRAVILASSRSTFPFFFPPTTHNQNFLTKSGFQ